VLSWEHDFRDFDPLYRPASLKVLTPKISKFTSGIAMVGMLSMAISEMDNSTVCRTGKMSEQAKSRLRLHSVIERKKIIVLVRKHQVPVSSQRVT